MNGSVLAWIVWGLSFLAIEVPAVVNKTPDDTLSEHLRDLFAWNGKPTGWIARRAAWIVALILLALHVAGVPYLSMHS